MALDKNHNFHPLGKNSLVTNQNTFELVNPLRWLVIIFVFVGALLSCQKGDNRNLVPGGKKRIISTAPSITEIVYYLGAADQLVGVSDYCTFPPQVKLIAKIGGLYNPNLEQVVDLKPDLIIILPSAKIEYKKLQKMGIEVLEIRNETVEEILGGIKSIGKAIDSRDESLRLIKELREQGKQQENIPPLSTLLVISRQPGELKEIYVAGGETYLSGFMRNAGFKNIFANLKTHYAAVSLEAIIAAQPQVIIETEMSDEDHLTFVKKLSEWQKFVEIPAVKNNHVFIVTSSFIHIPAIRIFRLQNTFKEIRKQIK